MAGHLELHRTDGGEHRRLIAAPVGPQNLHHAFLRQLLDAFAELLVLAGVGAPGDGEVFRGETRDRREVHGVVAEQGVAGTQCRRVGQTDHVARPCAVQGRALLSEHRLRVLGDERLTGGGMSEHVAALEGPRAHPRVGDPIAVRGVHPGLDLEHERAESRIDRAQIAVDVELPGRRRREPHQRVQQLVHPEVQRRRGEQDRRCLPPQKGFLVVVAAVRGEQLAFLGCVDPVDAGRLLRALRGDVFLRCRGGTAGRAGEPDVVAGSPIQHTLEVTGDPDRPCQRGGLHTDALLDLVEEFQGVAARTVPLVDHRDDRDTAVPAYLKKFQRLRLQALGGVDQHDRAVHRAEHPIGVFGEIGVAGGVEQVDDAVLPVGGAVGELQRGGGDGDASGLLHLHPVRHRGAAAGFAVNGPRFGDHPGV